MSETPSLLHFPGGKPPFLSSRPQLVSQTFLPTSLSGCPTMVLEAGMCPEATPSQRICLTTTQTTLNLWTQASESYFLPQFLNQSWSGFTPKTFVEPKKKRLYMLSLAALWTRYEDILSQNQDCLAAAFTVICIRNVFCRVRPVQNILMFTILETLDLLLFSVLVYFVVFQLKYIYIRNSLVFIEICLWNTNSLSGTNWGWQFLHFSLSVWPFVWFTLFVGFYSNTFKWKSTFHSTFEFGFMIFFQRYFYILHWPAVTYVNMNLHTTSLNITIC